MNDSFAAAISAGPLAQTWTNASWCCRNCSSNNSKRRCSNAFSDSNCAMVGPPAPRASWPSLTLGASAASSAPKVWALASPR